MMGTIGRAAGVGVALGFVLSEIGFGTFGQVHALLVLSDLRILFAWVGAVALGVLTFLAIRGKLGQLPKRPFHKGIVPGAALFGAGWAIAGACPATALVQLGEGYLPAAVTLVGIAVGTWVYPAVHKRFFRFDPGTCDG
jgi:uncharacterized membrane protein YedE/YeeE